MDYTNIKYNRELRMITNGIVHNSEKNWGGEGISSVMLVVEQGLDII